MTDIAVELLEHLRANSGLDQHRPYLGMSAIAECPLVLYRRFLNGRGQLTDEMHRICYLGYLFERDAKARLAAIGVYQPGSERELVAGFDARFKGHTDGETTDGRLLEIKSVNQRGFERVRGERRAKREHYEQVQTYMRYGNYGQALVVYVCRDTLQDMIFDVRPNASVAERLEFKAREVLAAIDAGVPPQCECGRCRD